MIFYVYEHWRLDKDECFYVGKGHGRRAYGRNSRNVHWRNIVNKLERNGFAYEVRIVSSNLTEDEAFKLEAERILFWSDIVDLSNKTNGGEGFTGGRHSEESKQKIAAGSRRTATANRGKMRARMMGELNPFFGKTHTKETMDRIKDKLTGRKISNPKPKTNEHKSSISATMKRKGICPPSRKDTKSSPETRKKQSESLKAYWASKKELV